MPFEIEPHSNKILNNRSRSPLTSVQYSTFFSETTKSNKTPFGAAVLTKTTIYDLLPFSVDLTHLSSIEHSFSLPDPASNKAPSSQTVIKTKRTQYSQTTPLATFLPVPPRLNFLLELKNSKSF